MLLNKTAPLWKVGEMEDFMEYVTLNNGVRMPKLGFGVYQIRDAVQCEQAVRDAVSYYKAVDL